MAYELPGRRSGTRTRLKVAVATALCHPWIGHALMRAFPSGIPARGLRVDPRWEGVEAKTAALLFWGLYESAEIRFLRKYCDPNADLLELGSSIGVVACHAARILTAERRLCCVEANPDLIDTVRANLQRHARGRSVEILNKAISYDGTPYVELEMGETNFTSRLASGGHRDARRVRVEAASLEDVLAQVGFEEFQLVCDIEGAEVGLFFGGRDRLRGCIRIIAELHDAQFRGRDYSVADLYGLVEQCGFRVVERHGPVGVFERSGA